MVKQQNLSFVWCAFLCTTLLFIILNPTIVFAKYPYIECAPQTGIDLSGVAAFGTYSKQVYQSVNNSLTLYFSVCNPVSTGCNASGCNIIPNCETALLCGVASISHMSYSFTIVDQNETANFIRRPTNDLSANFSKIILLPVLDPTTPFLVTVDLAHSYAYTYTYTYFINYTHRIQAGINSPLTRSLPKSDDSTAMSNGYIVTSILTALFGSVFIIFLVYFCWKKVYKKYEFESARTNVIGSSRASSDDFELSTN
jgi:hypothetical protein